MTTIHKLCFTGLLFSLVAASRAFVVLGPPTAQQVSAHIGIAKYRCSQCVHKHQRQLSLLGGIAFCPADNLGSDEPDGRAQGSPHSKKLELAFELPSPLDATNRLGPKIDDYDLNIKAFEGQEDPEAMHLWSKLPQKVKSAYAYNGILGRGSFGIVVLVQKKKPLGTSPYSRQTMPAKLAVKLIRTVYGAEPLAMREGLVLHSINSPLVPKCFDYGISNGVVYIIEEFVAGTPMDKVLEQGPIGSSEVAEVGCQVAAALSAIHANGFVHRDVKPHNIIRIGQGRSAVYRLIDFGAAVGINHSMSPTCYAEHTGARLKTLFRDMCRNSASGMLPASAVEECLRAVGLPAGLARQTSAKIMETLCHPSTSSSEVSEEAFMAMFDRIVREQDRGCPAGTLPFMAPEQLLHVDGYSPASDLYSLGITLYQLAAGKLPQQVLPEKGRKMTFRQSLEAWARYHKSSLSQQLPRISSGRTSCDLSILLVNASTRVDQSRFVCYFHAAAPGVFLGLEEAIAQALDKSPARRQRSARELERQLRSVVASVTREAPAL